MRKEEVYDFSYNGRNICKYERVRVYASERSGTADCNYLNRIFYCNGTFYGWNNKLPITWTFIFAITNGSERDSSHFLISQNFSRLALITLIPLLFFLHLNNRNRFIFIGEHVRFCLDTFFFLFFPVHRNELTDWVWLLAHKFSLSLSLGNCIGCLNF